MKHFYWLFFLCFIYSFGAYSADKGFSRQAEKILPTVVSVFVSGDTTLVSDNERPLPSLQNNMVGRIPDDFLTDLSTIGSGFIVSKEGEVLTNAHVIEGASDVMVMTNNGKYYTAQIVGKDNETDIALLKIQNAPKLKEVVFGDSDKIKVGDIALAVGNPYGVGNSMSAGIISARSRDIYAGPYDDFLQTDVAINRGSSGGPLFNVNMELIGLNTAILSQDGNTSGIGFAIPSNTVKSVYADLKKYGKVKRGKIGVKVQPLSYEFARFLGLNSSAGALISSVEPNGPASRIGIEAGDVILKFDGVKIDNMRQFPKLVSSAKIGSVVELVLWCEGQEITLKITIEEMDSDDEDGANIIRNPKEEMYEN